MIKKILAHLVFASCLTSFSLPAYASLSFMRLFIAHKHENCPKDNPTNHKQFCGRFKEIASCHCTSSGLPKQMCQDMNKVYQRMLMVFDTTEQACQYQRDVDARQCMDSWNCFRRGGTDSQGRLCSTTGKACATQG